MTTLLSDDGKSVVITDETIGHWCYDIATTTLERKYLDATAADGMRFLSGGPTVENNEATWR